MNLLVFNCGSSSQGFSVFDETGKVCLSGKALHVDTQTIDRPFIRWKGDRGSDRAEASFRNHREAALDILDLVQKQGIRVDAAAHRFVNGGTLFSSAAQLDKKAMEDLRLCLPLAPIHNPNSYSVIEVCAEKLPGVPQYAVFDTAFHSSLPPEAYVYALPKEYRQYRKIGFHGLSYAYISKRAAELLGRALEELRLIMCHLGNGGSSVCAMKNGKSLDVSMGYSPISGLVMSTRSGDLDPEIILDMVRAGMSPDDISDLLNRRSGVLGLSEVSSSITEASERPDDQNCKLAFDAYTLRLRKYIGAFLYEMNGADAIIFTDGAGLHAPRVRAAACEHAESLGILFDPEKNRNYIDYTEACISAPGSPVSVWVIPTNEEQTIFDEVMRLRHEA